MELAWGPTWSGSLKSLWLGEGEAIGDIVVGEELAEQLGTEPMHPVLMDLCTGVAFPAFPALLAAEQGVQRSVPAAAVRAGDAAGEDAAAVLLPRDVARQRPRQRNPGLRPRFRRPGWPSPGRDSRVHGQTRAARGVVARARRRCHPAAVHPWLARGAAAGGERGRRNRQRHLADRRVRRTGRPRCPAASRSTGTPIRSPWDSCWRRLTSAGCGFSGVVWRGTAPGAEESTAEAAGAARDRDRQPAQRRAHRAGRLTKRQRETSEWSLDRHRAGRGHANPASRSTRCRRRCGDSGAPRSTRNRRCAARLVDCDGSPEAVHALANLLAAPDPSAGAGTRAAARQVAGLAVAAVGAQRSPHRAALNRLRPGAHRTRRDRQPASDRDGRPAAGRGLRAGPGGGRGPQLPRRAQRPRPLPGRPRTDRRRLRRHRHAIG